MQSSNASIKLSEISSVHLMNLTSSTTIHGQASLPQPFLPSAPLITQRNIKHVSDWEHIRQHQQLRINLNNMRENMRRNNHQYKVGDKVLVNRKKNSKHELEFVGAFPIMQINGNGIFCFHKGIIKNTTNICRIKPFFD